CFFILSIQESAVTDLHNVQIASFFSAAEGEKLSILPGMGRTFPKQTLYSRCVPWQKKQIILILVGVNQYIQLYGISFY
ncbi:hypothetical protein ACJX0J_010361, partial [Zea mays]